MRKLILYCLLIGVLVSCNNEYSEITSATDPALEAKINLGEKLFFENKLSNPEGQSCASCHAPQTGFSDPNHASISSGVNPNLFGNRNAPSLAYNVFSPKLYYNKEDETFVGGFFLDGRANDIEEQVLGPLLNPVEMNNTSSAMIVAKLKSLAYYSEFSAVYGTTSDDTTLLKQLANAIATFETSKRVNSFTSKFDYVSRGLVKFTEDEKAGLALFQDKAKCAQCHVLDEDPNTGKILFTDFTYDNLGVPKNDKNPFYNLNASINPLGVNYIDFGIGSIVNQQNHKGKFKVPSLRNSAFSAPYFHNGVFKTLEEVIHFYNKRDVENLGSPETDVNVNKEELGDLKLTPQEEIQLKKFIETLTDHYKIN